MPKAVSMVRQATAAAVSYVGAISQLIVDTGLNVLRIHDGVTPGGFPTLGAVNNLSDLSNKPVAIANLGALAKANNLSDLVSAATARINLGLGTVAVLNTAAVCLTANNLSDLANIATARTNLGLGTAAIANVSSVGTVTTVTGSVTVGRLAKFSDTAGTLIDTGFSEASLLDKTQNLNDVPNKATARTNLGLGSAATLNASTTGIVSALSVGSVISGRLAKFADTSGSLVDTGFSENSLLDKTQNLSDVPNKATARSNLQINTFVSGYSTSFSANATFSTPHGLGSIAGKHIQLQWYLQNVIAEGGFSPGDQIMLDGNGSSSHAECGQLFIDGTNVGYSLGGNGVIIRAKGGGNAFGITPADWKAYICVTVIG